MTKFFKLHVRDSNPNYWYNFSDNIPLIAPVTARQASYWRDSSFS